MMIDKSSEGSTTSKVHLGDLIGGFHLNLKIYIDIYFK